MFNETASSKQDEKGSVVEAMRQPTASAMGDRAVLLDCRDHVQASELASGLRSAELADVQDIVPAARSLLVVFGLPADFRRRSALVTEAVAAMATTDVRPPAEEVELPVRYDGADLPYVARLCGMSVGEVIRWHAGTVYTVMFLGFVPGFAYLAGLDSALHVSRRADPRTEVPAGSVAIASDMSAVYPRPGPGGWQLIGSTTAKLFDPARSRPSLLTPGARVRFLPQ